MRAAPPAVVLALFTVGPPDIASAGRWGLFGGSIDGDETPTAAVRREIHEELGVDVLHWRELSRDMPLKSVRHAFSASPS